MHIKNRHDPGMLLYVDDGVGSEGWAIDDKAAVGKGGQSTNGALCRV